MTWEATIRHRKRKQKIDWQKLRPMGWICGYDLELDPTDASWVGVRQKNENGIDSKASANLEASPVASGQVERKSLFQGTNSAICA